MNNWKIEWENKREQFKERCQFESEKFISCLRNPIATQMDVLSDIVQVTKNAEFGKKHAVHKIDSAKTLRKQVPIRNYDQLAPWLTRESEKKNRILSSSPLRRWLKTSGSSGVSKKIPYTDHWMEKYRVPALCVLWGNYIKYAPEILSNPYATLDTQTIREPVKETINGIPYQGITNRNPVINSLDWDPPWYHAPWFNDEVPEGYENRMYYRLRYLLGNELSAVLAINPSTLIALKDHLVDKLPKLVEDVHNGTLNGKQIFEADPKLAQILERFIQGGISSLKDIWPTLSLVASWTSSSAKLYLSQLKNIYPGVKILPFMTCGTEGVVTLPIDDHEITGPLAINQGFYEFLPADVDLNKCLESDSVVDTLLFNELEIDKEYHLIMTQGSGLYRLAVGDIYKVIDLYEGVPRIEFSRRQGTYFSFTGEKLTEPQLLTAIYSATTQFVLQGSLFVCCPIWDKTPYYKILIEMDQEKMSETFCHNLSDYIDEQLSLINDEYDSKRKSKRIGRLMVCPIKMGVINKYNELQKANQNAVQYKYKPFQTDDKIFDELLRINVNFS